MICPELAMAEDMARSLYFSSMLMNRDLAKGLVELIEFKATEEMNILGPIEDVSLPKSCNIVAINRAGEIFIPKKGDAVQLNDHLMLLCDAKILPQLKADAARVSELSEGYDRRRRNGRVLSRQSGWRRWVWTSS